MYKNSMYSSRLGSMMNAKESRRFVERSQKFDPKEYLSIGITERDIELYKEVFDLFDIHGVGALNPNDLRNALEMFGYHPKREIVYQIIADLDSDESGGISFKEFLKIMTEQNRPCDVDTEEDYERVFAYFDADNKGFVDKEDIENVCMDINEAFTDKELKEIMDKLDPGRGEKCTFKSFYKNLQQVVSKSKKRMI